MNWKQSCYQSCLLLTPFLKIRFTPENAMSLIFSQDGIPCEALVTALFLKSFHWIDLNFHTTLMTLTVSFEVPSL